MSADTGGGREKRRGKRKKGKGKGKRKMEKKKGKGKEESKKEKGKRERTKKVPWSLNSFLVELVVLLGVVLARILLFGCW